MSMARAHTAGSHSDPDVESAVTVELGRVVSRRGLFRRALALTGAAVVTPVAFGGLLPLVGCSEATEPSMHAVLDLNTEPGVLNFLYAVLQLEADFYARLGYGWTKFPGILQTEATTLNNYWSQTQSDRDTVRTSLALGQRITDTVLFHLGQIVDYADRTDTLTNAQTIEDAAANGFVGAAASAALHTDTVRTMVQNIAASAVERANGIRAMRGLDSLVVTPTSPADIMATLAPYFYTTFTINGR